MEKMEKIFVGNFLMEEYLTPFFSHTWVDNIHIDWDWGTGTYNLFLVVPPCFGEYVQRWLEENHQFIVEPL